MNTAPDKQGTVTFLVQGASSFRLQRILAERIAAQGRQIAFLYSGPHDAFFDEVATYAARFRANAIALDESVERRGSEFRPTAWRAQAARASFRLLDNPAAAKAIHGDMASRLVMAVKALDALHAAVVLCSEDGITADLAVLAAARTRELPVIDVPFGDAGKEDFDNDLARKAKAGELIVPRGRARWLLRLVAPHWLRSGQFAGATMHRPEVVMAYEALSLPLCDPWIVHGGMSDVLCAESRMGLEQYRREGIPEAKLRLTGSPYCDALVDGAAVEPAAREALRRPRRIEPGTTRVLVSWPPSYHETYPGRSEFGDYTEMSVTVLEAIRDLPGVELTISLHPACRPGLRDALVERGLAPTDEYVIPLIGRHDVFVTYFSSTIRWALAAGKPVVNYDAYNLGLSTYDTAPGFTNVDSLAALRDEIAALAASDDRFAERAAAQIADADRWGVLDGACCARILGEIDRLAPLAPGG